MGAGKRGAKNSRADKFYVLTLSVAMLLLIRPIET